MVCLLSRINMMNLLYSIFILLHICFEVNGQDFECKQGTGFFPDPIQCDLYYICSKGVGEAKLCPDGLVFDDSSPNHERCDIPANIECGERTVLQEAKPSKGCPRANGYFRHEDPLACDKFFNCVDGVPHELPCPPGLVYDDTESTCAWPQDNHRKDCTKPRKDVLDDGFQCPDGAVIGPGGRNLPHPTFAHPDDCQKFYICRNGIVPQKGACSQGSVYNEDTFTCDDPENVPGCTRGVLVSNAPSCPDPHGVHAYAHPESCNLFFLCTNGTLTVEQCENGLLFDGKGGVHNHCNYNWAVECGERKADLTPISTPGCEYQFGIYPDSAECSVHYIKCAHGEPLPQQCEPGLAYDEKIHGCNWPDLLIEKCNPEAVVGFKCPTKVPAHSAAARFWPYPRFAVPGDCHRLITCVNGFPRLISCGEDKVFDESSLTCEEPELVAHCGGNHLKK